MAGLTKQSEGITQLLSQETAISSEIDFFEGLPKLGPEEDLIRRFYEGIVLLSILGPPAGSRTSSSTLKSSTEATSAIWHKFLDQLSWLCDYKCGGKTVTSIAAEALLKGSKFWVASNRSVCKKVLEHLEWVLRELQSLTQNAPSEPVDVERQVFQKSVQFSFFRVKNYGRKLCSYVAQAKSLMGNDSGDGILYECLEDLVKLKSDHEKLCLSAYNFPKTLASKYLSQKVQKGESSVWSFTRHYIGRLGSWRKASKVLTFVATKFPHLLEKFELSPVRSLAATAAPLVDMETKFRDLLGRVLPMYDVVHLERALRSPQSRKLPDVGRESVRRYNHPNFRPCVHAEVKVLEHFHFNNLPFVGDDRYIGCSKPSCYCCDLYMKFHPGSYQARPCHGNLWIKWCTPISLHTEIKEAKKHTEKIMRSMVERVQQDILSHIFSGPVQPGRMLDSTTGISTSASFPLK